MEIQILRVGQLVILCVPGELTTMAGRRLREAVQLQVHKEMLPCQSHKMAQLQTLPVICEELCWLCLPTLLVFDCETRALELQPVIERAPCWWLAGGGSVGQGCDCGDRWADQHLLQLCDNL